MARVHLRRSGLLVVSVCSLLFIAFLFYRNFNGPRSSRFDPQMVDAELWRLVREEERANRQVTEPALPVLPPQIHVKEIPSLSINLNWTAKQMEHTFYAYLENKDIRCENDQRIGNWHDGGWNVCLSPPYRMAEPCVIFSFGIGKDWQFDNAVTTLYGCEVFAFDPSISDPPGQRSSLINFQQLGLADSNYVNADGWKMKTLSSHLKDEGFWDKPVDYVKIDIEFSEWAVLEEAIKTEGTLSRVKQLGVEIHTPDLFKIYPDQVAAARGVINQGPLAFSFDPDGGGSKAGHDPKRTFVHMFETLHRLEILGFRKFNYRKNPFGMFRSNISGIERSCCYELHYINTHFLSDNYTVIHTSDSKIFH